MQWLRRRFVTGFFVIVPLIISVAALVWVFGIVDGITSPFFARVLGRQVPGLGMVVTGVLVLLVGVVATNVFGRRLLQRLERLLLQVPVFRTIYAPVRQLVAAFSPDNETGFKQVVIVECPGRGLVLGFLTREFSVAGPDGRDQAMAAVYVPTNHLYLGDVLIFPRESLRFPDLTVQDGIGIFLTGGASLPARVAAGGVVPVVRAGDSRS